MDPKTKAEHQKWLNHRRFRWHEAVLKDPKIGKKASALAVAGHVMHRYDPRRGFAQFSIASAEKALAFDQRTIKRARKLLVRWGWIRLVDHPAKAGPGRWNANRYELLGGPDDLLFDELPPEGDVADTEGEVSG